MLRIIIPGDEHYDESTEEFSTVGDITLDLEHSLVSLSKWESIFQKPFLGSEQKTVEEMSAYIMAMIITPDVDVEVLQRLSQDNWNEINAYIESPHSATTFGEMPKQTGRGEIITSELIYYWMVAFTIPFEAQNWHLNNLFALVRICNIKNEKPKKMSRSEIAQRNRDLNAQRRAASGSSG